METWCNKCRRNIDVGRPVFQLAQGRYFLPSITPTYSCPVIGEWHRECFENDPELEIGGPAERRKIRLALGLQEQPYFCELCRGEIRHRDLIFYGVFGDKPELQYIRPENRGYALRFVVHERCYKHPEITELVSSWDDLDKSKSI